MTFTNQYEQGSKERAKSATPDLKVVHDQLNNSYHSSLYRHQAQTQQQNDRSANTHNITTFNENASCGSAAPPLKGSSSLTPTYAQQKLTISDHLPSTSIQYTTGENDLRTTSFDYNSLYDAMDSTSSIGSTTAHHQQHDTRDSLDTMLSYLCKYDDLAQHMDAMDQTNTIPFLRVMYLGTASSDERQLVLKKLSDGLSETFFRHTPSTLLTSSTTPQDSKYIDMTPLHPSGFRERKYHLLPLNLSLTNNIDDDDDDDDDDHNNSNDYRHTTMFEDTGVSIVEADFTTYDSKITLKSHTGHQSSHCHDPELILRYVYTQCQQTHPVSTLQDILHPSSNWDNQHFNGRIFSDEKSNGIDLCAYFYHDAQSMAQVNKYMEMLWKINALGIPILPILSLVQQIPSPRSPTLSTSSSLLSPNSLPLSKMEITTTLPPAPSSPNLENFPSDIFDMATEEEDKGNHSGCFQQRPIDVRRNELAYLFSRWRIRMVDISNLNVIGQPSFQSKGKARRSSIHEDVVIENLLGQTWASSNLVSPTPYHVLTLYQFMAIDRWVISKLLMALKDQPKGQWQQRGGGDNNDVSTTSAAAATATEANDYDLTSSGITTPASTSSLASKTIITVQSPKEVLTTSLMIKHPSIFQSSNLEFLDLLYMPTTFYIWLFLLFALFSVTGLWVTWNGVPGGGGLLSLVMSSQQTSKTWRASLNMVPYQTDESMTFVVSVYGGHGQSMWAPEPPLLITNIPFPITTTTTTSLSHLEYQPATTTSRTSTCYSETFQLNDSADSSTLIVLPLPNKTYPHEVSGGHYFYLLPVPSCASLNPTIDYYMQVKPSAIFPAQPPDIVQGSPLQLPSDGFCGSYGDDFSTADSNAILSQVDPSQEKYKIVQAWRHIRNHTRFYIVHSIKIIELYWTAGA